jgi:hypothetical protein
MRFLPLSALAGLCAFSLLASAQAPRRAAPSGEPCPKERQGPNVERRLHDEARPRLRLRRHRIEHRVERRLERLERAGDRRERRLERRGGALRQRAQSGARERRSTRLPEHAPHQSAGSSR